MPNLSDDQFSSFRRGETITLEQYRAYAAQGKTIDTATGRYEGLAAHHDQSPGQKDAGVANLRRGARSLLGLSRGDSALSPREDSY